MICLHHYMAPIDVTAEVLLLHVLDNMASNGPNNNWLALVSADLTNLSRLSIPTLTCILSSVDLLNDKLYE